MPETENPEQVRQRIGKAISLAENALYTILVLVLAGGAFALLIGTVLQFGQQIFSGDHTHLVEAILVVLEDLLLVIMIVEIMHTVGISVRKQRLVCEPFLVVGIIAAVRRLLVVTAEQVNPSEAEATTFYMAMVELGVLAVLILTLVFGILILRRALGDQPAVE